MTDNTRNIITATLIILMWLTLSRWQTSRQLAELKGTFEQTTIPSASNAERIDSYNAGYRAGSMDIVAQLVECEGIKDETVLQYYYTASDTLARLGELDTEPYPCTE
jgi:hypothetical protein